MDLTSDEVFEFLSLYGKEPILWDPCHPCRKNRSEVRHAWQRIQNEFSVRCTVTDLKRKKESLMATFRPLVRKVEESVRSGDEVFRPTWFAYDKMASFLVPSYRAKHKTFRETEPRKRQTEDNEENDLQQEKRSKPDEFDAFGIIVASKLRKMNDLQRLLAEQVIHQILYKGMLNQLTDFTDVLTPPSQSLRYDQVIDSCESTSSVGVTSPDSVYVDEKL